MNKFKQTKIVILFGILILMMSIIVSATSPQWRGNNVNYTVVEDTLHYHNLSVNITGFNNDVRFAIDSNIGTYVKWTNSSGTYNVSADSISKWISIINSSTGKLSINATSNNQTGFFEIPFIAYNTTDSPETSSGVVFGFIINASNDPPNFYLSPSYSALIPITGSTEKNITLSGSDEEKQYPLQYNVTFLGCKLAPWSTKNDCNLAYNNITNSSDIAITSNTTSIFELSNLTTEDVGSYNLTICVHDNINGVAPPLYRDSNYDNNQSHCRNTTLTLLSSLSIDASNCSGLAKEGKMFNCTINITTQGTADKIDLSSYGFFKDSSYSPTNSSWFYPNNAGNSSNFFYSLPVSVTPGKENVGNWTIDFNVYDINTKTGKTADIELFVNYTESNVSLGEIPNITIYENKNITVTGYDDDLLIQDKSVKNEILNFTTNTSWVTSGLSSSSGNSSSSIMILNYSYAINHTILGNQSIMVNVTDVAGNTDSKIFIVDVVIDNPPKWNVSNPILLNLTEGKNFLYNLTKNVTDADGDNVTFYYKNISGAFDSMKTFGTQGIINFTPTDYDVGFHNVSIIASDGKINRSTTFIFNISNTEDVPTIYSFSGGNLTSITNGSTVSLDEKNESTFNITINDDDFLIPQKNYYNESVKINITFTRNTTNNKLFNFSFVGFRDNSNQSHAFYVATFNPNISQVGNWTVFLNATDANGNSTNIIFFLDIKESEIPPVLQSIKNQSLTIHDSLNLSVNATDDKDDFNNISLIYSISKLNTSAPNLIISAKRISANMDLNDSGIWGYNVTVKDSKNLTDSQIFYIYVYGHTTLDYPTQNSVFNLTENFSRDFVFIINQTLKTNLTYELWIGNMSCSFHDASNCIYGAPKLRESLTPKVETNNSVVINFLPDFNDETYGNLKNLTLRVYPSNITNLTIKQRESIATNFTFKLNISHTNAPMKAISNISLLTSDYNSLINLNLNKYFSDEDVSDSYYLQSATFVKVPSTGDIFITHINGWNIQIGTTNKTAHEEAISIRGSDNNTSDQIDNIQIKFTAPQVAPTPTPSSGGGGGGSITKLKFYSLRIITPGDITISDNNYIKIPFSLRNYGSVDLRGINLSSIVSYNNEFSDGIKITMDANYVNLLKAGEERNYTMKIIANTSKSGQYNVRLFANVSYPKLADWEEFFINLKKTKDTQAEKLLIFTKKIVADNPECLELTEDFRRAKNAFNSGNISESMKMAQKVTAACEDSIKANDQIRYSAKGFVEKNIYYILLLMLIMFASGFVIYAYKRARFNKSDEDEYLR